MTNNSNQFIAFEINGGADDVEISKNTFAGQMDRVLKSDQKIGKFKAVENTILNTTEVEVLNNLVFAINEQNKLPDEIKEELTTILKGLKDVKTSEEKISLFKKIAQINEKIINLGASFATITPYIQSLLSQLPN